LKPVALLLRQRTFKSNVYLLFSQDEALAKIDKATPCRYGAQTVLIVAYVGCKGYILYDHRG